VCNFVRLSKFKSNLIKRSTLRRWRVMKKHQEIFSKLGGSVIIDLEKLREIIERNRTK